MTIHHVVRQQCFQADFAPQSRPAAVSINCMSVQNPQDIYSRIIEGVEEAQLDTGHDGDDPIAYPGELSGSQLLDPHMHIGLAAMHWKLATPSEASVRG
jgi:hypothetical protein